MKFKLLFSLLILFKLSFSQTISVFDDIMLSKKTILCNLLSKYMSTSQHYEYYIMDTNYYGITSDGKCHNFSGTYNFAVRNDSLCQVYFSASFPRKSYSLKSINATIDSLLDEFTKKFGTPEQFEDYRKDSSNPDVIRGYTLLNSSWQTNKDIMQLSLSYSDSGFPNEERTHYSIRIHRYRECYADHKSLLHGSLIKPVANIASAILMNINIPCLHRNYRT